MKKKVEIYKILRYTPGGFHAICESNIGIIKKETNKINLAEVVATLPVQNKISSNRSKIVPEEFKSESKGIPRVQRFSGKSNMNFSVTYIGIIVSLVSFLAEMLKLNLLPGDIETTVFTIAAFVGAIVALYGRYRKGDITPLGVRIKEKVVEDN